MIETVTISNMREMLMPACGIYGCIGFVLLGWLRLLVYPHAFKNVHLISRGQVFLYLVSAHFIVLFIETGLLCLGMRAIENK